MDGLTNGLTEGLDGKNSDLDRLNRILGKNYFYQKTLLVSLKSFLGLNLELLDLYCDLFPLQYIEGKISLFPLMY